jgi:hypothetical protein
MEILTHDDSASPRGRAFLWGGVALGVVLIAALLSHGFGLFGGGPTAAETPLLLHRGDKIVVPEGSSLRRHLTVMPAAARPVAGKLLLPGVVESDPARTAAVLTPLAGRLTLQKHANAPSTTT